MSSTFKYYRDPETGHRYAIEYRKETDGTYSLWAHQSPPNPHGDGPSVHHLYASGRICVAGGAEPRTLERAKAIAMYWMNGFTRYIQSGTYPKAPGRVNV